MKILLKQIMDDRNLSVRQVEMLTGVPKSTVSDIRAGAMPKLDTLEMLAAGLKIRITDLFESEYK
mgnify:CR=1 FL=1